MAHLPQTWRVISLCQGMASLPFVKRHAAPASASAPLRRRGCRRVRGISRLPSRTRPAGGVPIGLSSRVVRNPKENPAKRDIPAGFFFKRAAPRILGLRKEGPSARTAYCHSRPKWRSCLSTDLTKGGGFGWTVAFIAQSRGALGTPLGGDQRLAGRGGARACRLPPSST